MKDLLISTLVLLLITIPFILTPFIGELIDYLLYTDFEEKKYQKTLFKEAQNKRNKRLEGGK